MYYIYLEIFAVYFYFFSYFTFILLIFQIYQGSYLSNYLYIQPVDWRR